MGLAPPPPSPTPLGEATNHRKGLVVTTLIFLSSTFKNSPVIKRSQWHPHQMFLGPVTVQSPMSEVHNYLPLFFFCNFLAVKGSLDSWLKLNHRLKLHLVFYVKPTTTTVVWNTVLQVVRYPFSMNPAVVCGKDTKEIVSCFTGDRWGEYDHQNTCHGWFS